MQEIAKIIVTEGGWIALALIALLFVLGGVVYILFKLVTREDVSDRTVATQAASIAQLVTLGDALKSVTENLARVAELLSAHHQQAAEIHQQAIEIHQQAAEIRTALDSAADAMRSTSAARNEQMEKLPQKVREVVLPDLKEIPAAIEAALVPKLDSFQEKIEGMINTLDNEIKKAPAETEHLMRKTWQEIRAEIVLMVTEIVTEKLKASTPNEPAPPGEEKKDE